jgi:hypothetical protein
VYQCRLPRSYKGPLKTDTFDHSFSKDVDQKCCLIEAELRRIFDNIMKSIVFYCATMGPAFDLETSLSRRGPNHRMRAQHLRIPLASYHLGQPQSSFAPILCNWNIAYRLGSLIRTCSGFAQTAKDKYQ